MTIAVRWRKVFVLDNCIIYKGSALTMSILRVREYKDCDQKRGKLEKYYPEKQQGSVNCINALGVVKEDSNIIHWI